MSAKNDGIFSLGKLKHFYSLPFQVYSNDSKVQHQSHILIFDPN